MANEYVDQEGTFRAVLIDKEWQRGEEKTGPNGEKIAAPEYLQVMLRVVSEGPQVGRAISFTDLPASILLTSRLLPLILGMGMDS